MVEIELKFQLAGPVAALRRAVATRSAQRTRLQARYFDTPDRALAAAGFALRLRRENGRWVQTLKGRGDGLMARSEHNAELAGRGEPALDLARHDGTPAGTALARSGIDLRALQPLFETDVLRVHRRLRSGGAVVELALDEGAIVAGARRLPLCELEFELVSGPPQALLELAARWVERHGLWLDLRTKAERGDLLARGLPHAPPTRARPPQLAADADPAQALRQMVRACLDQVLPNASAVGAGGHEPEHVHQLRVGLRRLRTALRVFGDAAPDTDSAWEPALAAAFGRLGSARDLDALAETLLPALRAAGAPLAELAPAGGAPDPGLVVREPGWSTLMLALIGFVQAPPEGDHDAHGWALPDAEVDLRDWARRRLARAHKQAVRDAADFASLPEELQHRTRKRVKRLRYSTEFVCSLFAPKAVERYLKRLRPAQESLGEYNDLLVAQAAFRERIEADPQAWFALGWLAAQREVRLAHCTAELRRLAKAPPFWK